MERRLIGSHGMMLAAAAAMLEMSSVRDSFELLDVGPRKRVAKMPRRYGDEANRTERRAADRSRKQYLLKGIRP